MPQQGDKKINPKLLEILACPLCRGNLDYQESTSELICYQSKLAFKIKNGIPIMLIDEARRI